MTSEANNYCKNLMEVNKTHKVVASQPIYNENGVLLLAEGAEISEKRAEILLHHKLIKPLEQCVGIASSLSARELFGYLNKFAESIPGLKAVIVQDEYQKSLRQMCLFYERYPLLQQNLTVLALRAQRIYYHALFSAMAGLAIATQLKLNQRELQTTFIAGLFHDVGFLYLDPELSIKTQDFTQNEWKALQAHPLIAQRFLNLVPELSKDIGQAIANHHERIDGTGYPFHVFGDKLPLVSQIIAATDNMIFNHMRYQDYGPNAHNMLLTALKLSDNIYFEAVYDAALILFKHHSPTSSNQLLQIPSAEELLTRQKMLHEQFEQSRSLCHKLMTHSKGPLIRSISAVMGRLAIAVVRSGILQPEQGELLIKSTCSDTGDDVQPIIEISVMLDQIHDQLLHLKNLMERAIEAIPENEAPLKTLAIQSLVNIDLQDSLAS